MLLNANKMSTLQFGEFAVDRARRRLLRSSQPVALSAKAFDLLVFLVENPGRPLSKDEILQGVWPDAIVEESNLTQNVFLLRKALGTEGQHAIATLPGRGYQFTAHVVEVPLQSAPAAAQAADLQTVEATHSHVLYEEETEDRIVIWQSPLAMAVLVGGILLLGVAGWLGWQRYEDRVGGPPVQVVVAGFQGGTGDAALDQALNTALRMGLSQSPYVTIVSQARVRQTLDLMTLKPDAELTPTVAHDVCERTGSQAVLRGTVAQTGSHYLLTGEAIGCADGATIATYTQEAPDRESLPHAVDKLASSLRHGLGESRRMIARFSQPVIANNGRTNSMEALEAASQASVESDSGNAQESVELLKHAVALDPEFAVAWFDLYVASANINDRSAMIEYLKRAYAVRFQATAPARYLIEARYAAEVEGNLVGAEQSYKAMLALYPRNVSALGGLGETQREMGHHADAISTYKRQQVLAPNLAGLYYVLCSEETKAGLLDEAQKTCESGLAHGLDSELIRLAFLQLAIAKRDPQLYGQQIAWNEQHHSSLILAEEAEVDLLQGRVHDAVTHLEQSCALLEPAQDSVCNQYHFDIASELASLGEIALAKQIIGKRTPDPSDPSGLQALAQTGDLKGAEQGLKEQERITPPSPSWEATVGSLVRANILLEQHRPAEVAAALELSRPFDDTDLEYRYLRGLGYAESGQMGKAEAEFRRLLSATYIAPESVDVPLAQLGLARVLAQQGKTAEAVAAYQSFFQTWQHADGDLPLLKAARLEFAPLSAAHH